MKTPHEPLTPEERTLAQSLSRLGPHGGPSPGLDARILAAARAAVQEAPAPGGQVPPPRRRWPLGLGVAASVLLAAGVAWQLRPAYEVPVASEVPAAAPVRAPAVVMDSAEADIDPAAASAAPVAVQEAPAPALPPAAPADAATSGPARKNAEAAARQEAAPKRGPLGLIPAVPGLSAPEAPRITRSAPQAFPAEAASASAPTSAPAPVVADEAMEMQDTAAAAQARERAATQQQEQRVRYEDARQEKARATDARALDSITVTGSRIQNRGTPARAADAAAAPVAVTPPSPPAPPPPAASAGSGQPSAARTALRRTDLQVPVDEDTRLPPDEWLERIRLRRDLGDSANALRSLQLFVQAHPFQRVPDDLRPLLGTP
ncbi:hypothetical protein [Pseudoxanthomonas mexicana]|uniref:hypothetical protein n=1 Tax=Pseudoxanthomonas mexicana TaxID=128785 RepID=UPI0028A2CFD1|nr:hypothetical protein [Pseudoxanthomonas mexicana]